MKTLHVASAVAMTLVLGLGAAAMGCHPTSHASTPAALGQARSTADLEAVVDQPGPLTVETVIGADWEVDRAGLLNLDHPKARAAGLKDGGEPIHIAFHAVHHPTRGSFLVDTGAERALRDDPAHTPVGGSIVAGYMHLEKLHVRTDTAAWLAKQKAPVAGVFLTHLHLDHITGMRDVPAGTPVYAGPGEAEETGVLNLFVRPVTDAALEGKGAIHELRFSPDPSGAFEGVLDVFGDGTFWALHVPGHTPGSTAFVARTPNGPVLLTGDACHTAWGWENGVEPGTFSDDRPKSAVSLSRLRRFAAKHPGIDVRPGHQSLPSRQASR
jgi:glyoxylase-like metal-dependent hydrolase (beta-lactamase superfamily II)